VDQRRGLLWCPAAARALDALRDVDRAAQGELNAGNRRLGDNPADVLAVDRRADGPHDQARRGDLGYRLGDRVAADIGTTGAGSVEPGIV
jgi:hypothetical protein